MKFYLLYLRSYILVIIFFILTSRAFAQRTGTLDYSFNPPHSGITSFGADNSILKSIILRNGKIIIVGDFNTYNQTQRSKIARLHPDGTLDISFNPGTGANDRIWTVVEQPDGKLLIGGRFTRYNGIGRLMIARLQEDGSLDSSFDPGLSVDQDNDPHNFVNGTTCVTALEISEAGKIMVGGKFNYFNSTARPGLARLHSTGALDLTFEPKLTLPDVVTIAKQPDGKWIVASRGSSGQSGIYKLERLTSEGDIDPTFNTGGSGPNYFVSTINMEQDGKMFIGGYFTAYNGHQRKGVTRLNANGSLDLNFTPQLNHDLLVFGILLQPDGKVIIGGGYSDPEEAPRKRLLRLGRNGTVDNSFNPTGLGPNTIIYSILGQPDGKVIISGAFVSYEETNRHNIVRLFGSETVTGTSQELYTTNIHVYPNPFTSEFTIKLPQNSSEKIQISLSDGTGSIVFKTTIDIPKPNLSLSFTPNKNLPKGLYILKVKQGSSDRFFKLLKL